ncbi:sulfotransferase [Sphingomonas sp. AR_OL41]|uniref:tetratricopeptide repeat-containing sulfotransferase family protein n=1 Tax=Sphingomonas sp. AR_OL41 TaxID=3042729 RepID=UPI002480EE23|nr:tetratricopeptide repeat-containing sulfotransferase family protein [Sphingomonas sp. AR_OL41]MDH7974842.1 sulfotransferase [Sphingomonas sp. AR_OL41]
MTNLLTQIRALSDTGHTDQARATIRAAARQPALPATAWRAIGDAWHIVGDAKAGGIAHLRALELSIRDRDLLTAADGLARNDLPVAEPLLRARLKEQPTDIAAIRMLAELAGRIGRYRDAENLLRRAVELAPDFHAARANLATVLHRQNKPVEALAELDRIAATGADNASHDNLRAAALGRLGAFEEAIQLYERILAEHPDQPKVWMSHGHVLKTVGRLDDSIHAYRRALSLAPTLGEVWWSLANLKTVRFDEADIAAMERALAADGLAAEDRFHLEFALGKAHEDRRAPEAAFACYDAANRNRRALIHYDAAETTATVDRMIATLTPALFERLAGAGYDAPDPIFILGMPRAGSTLIEQILASHSQVEGTSELPDIPVLAGRIADYPTGLATAEPTLLRDLGERYLDRTRALRREGKPRFIDKLPNNWLHTGLIHLILPRATIIDARRHPLDCCWSNFKQHFARGQGFAYDLADLGHYYADYVRLMAHVDAVLPGRVHRVIHERLVDDPEREVRALLTACGLPFEEACLRFHENTRPVRTPSSEQVRRPISRDGMDAWRPFDPWLAPLRVALGKTLTDYPDAPDFD